MASASCGSQDVGGQGPVAGADGLDSTKSSVIMRQGTAPGIPLEKGGHVADAGRVEVGADSNIPPHGHQAGDRGHLER